MVVLIVIYKFGLLNSTLITTSLLRECCACQPRGIRRPSKLVSDTVKAITTRENRGSGSRPDNDATDRRGKSKICSWARYNSSAGATLSRRPGRSTRGSWAGTPRWMRPNLRCLWLPRSTIQYLGVLHDGRAESTIVQLCCTTVTSYRPRSTSFLFYPPYNVRQLTSRDFSLLHF